MLNLYSMIEHCKFKKKLREDGLQTYTTKYIYDIFLLLL